MTTKNKELSAYYYQQHDRFYLGNSEKQYQVVVRASNGKSVSVLFDEEQEIDGLPPSEVVQIIKERIKSYWIMTDREKRLEQVAWFEENAEQLDSGWAKSKIESLKKEIAQLEHYIIEQQNA